MDPNITYKGIITFYHTVKRFGFIDTQERKEIFFFLNNTEVYPKLSLKDRKYRMKFFKGDQVSFKIKYNESGDLVAYDLEFISNENFDRLLSKIAQGQELLGYLKKIGDEYYIKDIDTYIFIPLSISVWEKDHEEIYDNRLNRLLSYTMLGKASSQRKLKAALTDRRFIDDYFTLKEFCRKSKIITATITGKSEKGYYANLLDDRVKAFIRFDKKHSFDPSYHKLDEVEVMVTGVHESNLTVRFVFWKM